MKYRLKEGGKKIGVNADTLRSLERRGLITFTRDYNGHRRLTEEDLAQAEAILFPEQNLQGGTHYGKS